MDKGEIRWVITLHPLGKPMNSEGSYSLLPCASYQLACDRARKVISYSYPRCGFQVFPIGKPGCKAA